MHIINNADVGMTHTKPLIPDAPFHPGPTYRPPPKPIRSNVSRSQESSQSSSSVENVNPDIKLDFKKVLFPKHFKDQTGHSFKTQKNKQSHKHG